MRGRLIFIGILLWFSLGFIGGMKVVAAADGRPNILVAISDDQSYPHASAYGDPAIRTPSFDRVAKSGILFHNAFTPAPGCSPMRAAFLTGREIWQIREAGTHASSFPRDLPVYPQQLAAAGYHVGMTGKGWGPGKAIGWAGNPAGQSYSQRKLKAPKGISGNDYAANFDDFLAARKSDQPFCFWFGAHEPHRVFGRGLGKKSGVDPQKIRVPSFLPDNDEVRNDMADYMNEIQWFDSHLGRMLDRLEESGELANTLVVVTSDNGMSFPRAKANCYEYGIHMPLAMAWPKRIAGQQDVDDLVSLIDVTKSIFSAAGVQPKEAELQPGLDLIDCYGVDAAKTVAARPFVFSGRERHSSSRYRSLGYPIRCIRSQTHLYIRNFRPERWPAGAPQKFAKAKYDAEHHLVESQLGPVHGGYHDIDACPTLDWMIKYRDQSSVQQLLNASTGLRDAEELYDIRADPDCMRNLIDDPGSVSVRDQLAARLKSYLAATGDDRITEPEFASVWETYPRYSSLRWFPKPDWAIENPQAVPDQPWLEDRMPRKTGGK